ncbi:galactokinase [Anaerolinea thermophila]|uniref:Galactokinase n=1 Tax=Anaerolinea thermophila (strain DSM 14523 / JCM 11388 / NBRC 100420 / UNI-1) TaxID=926569 RepID=E8N505_ANATU|nr:galactokinase family protein [Anaerolinea thermophila]BAJ63519.1 galactokinase [Anaerolinea thermophila UNI-1]
MALLLPLYRRFKTSLFPNWFSQLYGQDPARLQEEQTRWLNLLSRFQQRFPGVEQAALFSTPGRTEVGGNHTDHNQGRVLAAAVDRDVIAVAAPASDGKIILASEGYPLLEVDTRDLSVHPNERGTTPALVRGVCARLAQLGYAVGGFRAVMTSSVPKGSGLSSSAAFEVAVATILNHLYNGGRIPALTCAQIGQYAENVYFGKPCGLMDQTAAAVGGFVSIDFAEPEHPAVHQVHYDFAHSGYEVIIVETGGDHADLTADYASIREDMQAVAAFFGKHVLREVSREELLRHLAELRRQVHDRAILRALHFFDDNQRVEEQVAALEANRFDQFLRLVRESGRSSWMLLQNGFSHRKPEHQGIPLAQAISEILLGERGAWRVHGGGFAGTIQAFVPKDQANEYIQRMEAVFGRGSCYPVSIRQAGSVRLDDGEGDSQL